MTFRLQTGLALGGYLCIHGLMSRDRQLVIDTVALGSLSASEIAFRTIWQLISRGTFESGAIFTEERLAGLLSISRTPLRETARRLEGLGLLERKAARAAARLSGALQKLTGSEGPADLAQAHDHADRCCASRDHAEGRLARRGKRISVFEGR
jgi:DNA-binding FadR family transcriptional regulator